MELILIAAIIMGSLIYMQHAHQQFLLAKEHLTKRNDRSVELEAHLKDLEEMKKRLDVLTLKAGFKL
jgi:hypothetical protein